jgi:hypothetical protein
MIYEANGNLTGVIDQNKKRLIRNFIFAVFVVLAYSVKMNKVAPIGLLYVFSELLLILVLAFFQYDQIIKPGRMVNKTAARVTLLQEEIIVETFPFKVLFLINKPSCEMKFKIDELKIKKTSNPIKPYFGLDNKIFLLTDREKEAYIIVDYFEKALDEKLKQIFVDVTPENLLIPGRLRHY